MKNRTLWNAGFAALCALLLAGGVSANSAVRAAFEEYAGKYGWTIHLPRLSFTTDNAAMVAITGYYKFQDKDFCDMSKAPFARVEL